MLNVITVKTGSAYSADYVNKMYCMVSRNLHIPFEFHCITEDPAGLDPDIQVITPPEVLNGWWNKLYVFSDLMPTGQLLYLDLDQVITGDITDIVEECIRHPFSCYSDHIDWMGVRLGTALMTFTAGLYRRIFDEFWPLRHELADAPGGDQVWLGPRIENPYYLGYKFPDAVKSFKFDIVPSHQPPSDGTKLINFHGRPKPKDVVGIPWVKQNWR